MSKATHMAEISQNTPKNTPETPETHYISPKTGHKVKISTLDNLKPAVKGEVRNPEGRAAGTKIRKTKQWEVLHEHISGVHTERFNRAMKQLPDKEFIDAYLRILEYFKPRLQRAENINMYPCQSSTLSKRFYRRLLARMETLGNRAVGGTLALGSRRLEISTRMML